MFGRFVISINAISPFLAQLLQHITLKLENGNWCDENCWWQFSFLHCNDELQPKNTNNAPNPPTNTRFRHTQTRKLSIAYFLDSDNRESTLGGVEFQPST